MSDAINITDGAIATMKKAGQAIEQLQDRSLKMESLLAEVRAQLEDHVVDVVDGDYGFPAPNWAMSLVREIDELIGKD